MMGGGEKEERGRERSTVHLALSRQFARLVSELRGGKRGGEEQRLVAN